MRARPRNGGRGLGVTGRLLALVLVPLLGTTVVVAATIQTKRQAAQVATTVQAAVDRVTRLADLRTALVQERTLVETVGVSRSFGLTMEQMTTIAGGTDLATAHRDALAATDAALAAAPYPEVISAADVAQARATSGTGELTERTLTSAYQTLFDRSLTDIDRVLSAVETSAGEVPGGSALVRELTAIRESLNISEGFGQQMLQLELLFFRKGDAEQIRERLSRLVADERRAYDELGRIADPAMVEATAALRREPSTEVAQFAVTEMIRGVAVDVTAGAAAIQQAGEFDRAAVAYTHHLTEFVRFAVGRVDAVAATLYDDSRHDLQVWSSYGAALIALSLALSVLIARSITRPLHRLADHAAAVGSGDLDVGELPARGPRDLAVTSQAFNDLVGNLRLLDAKARALAELDFDADALAEPLAGPLGESLQRSASVLSGSVTERDELRSRILYQASYDEVTGLHNRSAAADHLDRALTRGRNLGRAVAVLAVDVDDFKRLNDTLGRSIGDSVLREVGQRLTRAASVSSLVARTGNDEYAVLIENVTDPDPVTELARRLVADFSSSGVGAGITSTTSISVGIAFSWDGLDEPEQLLAGAELALARAKGRGPGSVELFDAELQRQLVHQAAVEEALTGALGGDDELFLQYQPVVELATDTLTGVEALVRWNRPGRGVQPPDSFIPVAERSSLILELDRWVLGRAARQITDWQQDPLLRHTDVAVNISARHVTSQALHAQVDAIVQTHALDPRRVIVELTETALVDDLAVAGAQLEAVRRLGVRTALDDFGTGYTSIAHLRQLPLDIIKIDRSFVCRLADPRERALLRMITDLGHELGATITAEGVETADQYRLVHDLGCDRAQGFLLSRPLDPEDLRRWAHRHLSGAANR